MPGELLFDLNSIDLSQVVCNPRDLDAILPQSGDMRQLDRVIYMDDAHSIAIGVKDVRDDEFWVPGHIPGRPLLPGVLMIEAAAQLASVLFSKRITNPQFLGFTRCDEVCFRGQVAPGNSLYLIAKEVQFKPRRMICATQAIVNGKLVYEGMITGMGM